MPPTCHPLSQRSLSLSAHFKRVTLGFTAYPCSARAGSDASPALYSSRYGLYSSRYGDAHTDSLTMSGRAGGSAEAQKHHRSETNDSATECGGKADSAALAISGQRNRRRRDKHKRGREKYKRGRERDCGEGDITWSLAATLTGPGRRVAIPRRRGFKVQRRSGSGTTVREFERVATHSRHLPLDGCRL